MSYRAVDFEVSTLDEISRLNLFVLHKHKTELSASEFENERSQTLDTLLLFTQFMSFRYGAKGIMRNPKSCSIKTHNTHKLFVQVIIEKQPEFTREGWSGD